MTIRFRQGSDPIWPFAIILAFLLTAACAATGPSPYQETHALTNLTVVFLDDASLRKQYEAFAQTPAVTFSSFATSGSVKTVRGFYDYRTKTIYCPKMDFQVCGHELHHATIGRFHPDH